MFDDQPIDIENELPRVAGTVASRDAVDEKGFFAVVAADSVDEVFCLAQSRTARCAVRSDRLDTSCCAGRLRCSNVRAVIVIRNLPAVRSVRG